MAKGIQKHKLDLYIIAQVTKLRTELGYTQEDIAIHLEVSTGYIGQVESPKSRAKYNIHHLNALAKLFKCSPKDFMPEKPM
ncbi:helix-turn-helix domain-containing protein [Flavihumibacter solisilvae]|uniref:HTH cro/C1-type domain-containing protein n=1 Tax=Flavihumibacter solisilvae TaxID=1349421 RepID=A0A0C1KXN4_9BACT|nr:helix-turn-helix transcriptional regulator [Flavihumibacter solisilvae]KIC92006.1 hypothetical protein OI18_22045 [Flavihumibacter solisilvae]